MGVKYLLITALITTSLLRLIPYLITGIPYHTDSYALLPLIDLLKSRTPVGLSPNNGFDNYNIYWPGTITYGVVHSVITGLEPESLMPITMPLINSLSVLMIAAFLRSLGMPRYSSMVAGAIYGLVGTEAVLGAGVTKEGYALTLMAFLLVLTSAYLLRGCKYVPYLATLTYLALVMVHHLTSVMSLLLTTYLLLTYLIGRVAIKRALTQLASQVFNALILLTYTYLYSFNALPTLASMTASDAISLTAYEVITALPIWLSLITRRELTKLIRAWFIAIYSLVITLSILSTRVELVVGAPKVSIYELMIFTPYLVVASISVAYVGRVREQYLGMFTYLTVLGLVGIEFYLIFGTPGLISEAYRLTTFTYLGIAVLTAYAFSTGPKYLKPIIVLTLVITAYVVPYTAFNSGYVGGSQRAYSESDLLTAHLIKGCGGNVSVCGDLRLKYLLYPRDVDVASGLNYFMSGLRPRCYLVVNELFNEVGYIATAYGIPVTIDSDTLNANSLIYFGGRNLMVKII